MFDFSLRSDLGSILASDLTTVAGSLRKKNFELDVAQKLQKRCTNAQTSHTRHINVT